LIAFASVAALLLSWTLLATIYTPIVWLVALYGNRELSLRRSWKLAGAALMPGALWEIGILAGYSLGRLDLVPFLAATSAHVVIGWLFLLLSPWSLARAASSNVNRGNPFVADRPARMDRN
jgi:hypothetical protein